jgi:polygalacturonase
LERIFEPISFGAAGDGKAIDTAAVQSAIDAASASGGGAVVLRKGNFRCGSIFLKTGVRFIIERNASIVGSRDLADYVIQDTRFEGRTCRWPLALVNASGLSDVCIEGEGAIDGDGEPFWKQFWDARREAVEKNAPFTNRDIMRPRLVFVDSCSLVSVRGVELRNSAFWNLHLYNSDQVTVEGISVKAPHEGIRAASSDAMDIDACANVLVRDCSFATDDDCVCIKGGKGADAHEINRPTENIVVERCHFGFGHGVITFGSEACKVRNVTVRDCVVEGENNTVRFKFRDDTVQSFENIVFERIDIRNSGWLFDMKSWVSRQDEVLASGLPTTVRNLVVRDITATGMKSPGIIAATPPAVRIENVLLERINVAGIPGATDCAPSREDDLEQLGGAIPGKLTIVGVSDCRIKDVIIDGKKMEPM